MLLALELETRNQLQLSKAPSPTLPKDKISHSIHVMELLKEADMAVLTVTNNSLTLSCPEMVMKGLHLNIVFPITSNMYNNVAAVRRLQGEKIHRKM